MDFLPKSNEQALGNKTHSFKYIYVASNIIFINDDNTDTTKGTFCIEKTSDNTKTYINIKNIFE